MMGNVIAFSIKLSIYWMLSILGVFFLVVGAFGGILAVAVLGLVLCALAMAGVLEGTRHFVFMRKIHQSK